MKRLWIADVHANLPALEAVLRDAGQVDEIVFLGDIVGYGPHPSACVDRLNHLQAKAVLGNHDAFVLASGRRVSSDSSPVDWDEWTRDQLSDSHLSYLTALPLELEIMACGTTGKAMHQPPGAPYLHPAMPDRVLADHLQDVSCALLFCGHSHRGIDRNIDGRRFVCVPPVGQPRNGDTRAGYAVESDGRLEFKFVSYDIESVVLDVLRIGLAPVFCRRWVNFLRTGFDTEWSREYKRE